MSFRLSVKVYCIEPTSIVKEISIKGRELFLNINYAHWFFMVKTSILKFHKLNIAYLSEMFILFLIKHNNK